MKRFTFKGVLENFRQSVSQPTKSEQPEFVETLRSEHCQLARVSVRLILFFSAFHPAANLYSDDVCVAPLLFCVGCYWSSDHFGPVPEGSVEECEVNPSVKERAMNNR